MTRWVGRWIGPWVGVATWLVGCGTSGGAPTPESSPPSSSAGADASVAPGSSPDAGVFSPVADGGASTTDAGVAEGSPTIPFACTGKNGGAGDSTLLLTSGGYARDALLHVPASYDATQGTMLVLNYHGYTSNAAEQILLTRMNPVADARGFIVVYPDGLGAGWNAGDCCTETQPPNVDDVQFTKDLLTLLVREYCIDPARIYATGFSNGGFMAHDLACTMADTFAAVAPVSGVLGIDPSACTPARPVPIDDFHGTADPVVPYDGGSPLQLLPPIDFRSVPSTLDFWHTTDACPGAPTVSYQQGTATCMRWSGCGGGSDVELCTLAGEGHEWPGGLPVPALGASTDDVDATSRMIDFFEAHPMPKP